MTVFLQEVKTGRKYGGFPEKGVSEKETVFWQDVREKVTCFPDKKCQEENATMFMTKKVCDESWQFYFLWHISWTFYPQTI